MTGIYFGAAVLALAIFFAVWHHERYALRVKKYTISIWNLPSSFDGYTLLHLSDLHSKRFGRGQNRLLYLLGREDFDVVAITGDLVNKFRPDFLPARELIAGIGDKPVFFVPGNHEWKTGFRQKAELRALGVRILQNTHEKMEKDGGHLWMVGVDDPHTGKAFLDRALEGTGDGAPKILLAHAPDIIPKAAGKVDLVMAGHTHGGQVRFPFMKALFAPGQGLFPKWDYGRYRQGKTAMIISPGLGESDLPIRFNIKPEVVLITLVCAGE